MTDSTRYLSAAQAAARLGVKPATLYAYVSRGLITHIHAQPASSTTPASPNPTSARLTIASLALRLPCRPRLLPTANVARPRWRDPVNVIDSIHPEGPPLLTTLRDTISASWLSQLAGQYSPFLSVRESPSRVICPSERSREVAVGAFAALTTPRKHSPMRLMRGYQRRPPLSPAPS